MKQEPELKTGMRVTHRDGAFPGIGVIETVFENRMAGYTCGVSHSGGMYLCSDFGKLIPCLEPEKPKPSAPPDTTTTEGKIAVMQAYVDGKTVEWSTRAGREWRSGYRPGWNWDDFDYRIKPEPVDPFAEFIAREYPCLSGPLMLETLEKTWNAALKSKE